jgi:hypothetical protein
MKISAKVNIEGALAKFKIAAEEAPKAVQRALNKTAITARAQAARSIRDTGYGLKVGVIKDAFSIRRATQADLKAILTATGKAIPLIDYGARQTSRGVTVNVKNGRKLIAHAFIATMPSGHKGVFIRVDNRHKRVIRNGKVYSSGLPIKELFGPSIPSAFANDAVQDALKTAIEERFPVVLKQELKFAGVLR